MVENAFRFSANVFATRIFWAFSKRVFIFVFVFILLPDILLWWPTGRWPVATSGREHCQTWFWSRSYFPGRLGLPFICKNGTSGHIENVSSNLICSQCVFGIIHLFFRIFRIFENLEDPSSNFRNFRRAIFEFSNYAIAPLQTNIRCLWFLGKARITVYKLMINWYQLRMRRAISPKNISI